jgi:hypothetical protein
MARAVQVIGGKEEHRMPGRIEVLRRERWFRCVVCNELHLECEPVYAAHVGNRRSEGVRTILHEHLEETT